MALGMIGISQLLTICHAYARLEGIELSTVSSRVFDDGKKVSQLEAGSDIQVRRLERALQWFSEHWPEGASWPRGVDRPLV